MTSATSGPPFLLIGSPHQPASSWQLPLIPIAYHCAVDLSSHLKWPRDVDHARRFCIRITVR
jgi:hypothetical protein